MFSEFCTWQKYKTHMASVTSMCVGVIIAFVNTFSLEEDFRKTSGVIPPTPPL